MSTLLRSATLVTIVGGLCLLTACSSARRPVAESATAQSAPAARTAPASAPAAPGSPAGTTPAASRAPDPTGASTRGTDPARATRTATATGGGGADPCPVTEVTLLDALKASPDFYRRTAQPTQLQDARCVSGYAIAGTVSDGRHQTVDIVFGFDAAHWRPLNIGSGDYCEGFVPADVAAKLRGC